MYLLNNNAYRQHDQELKHRTTGHLGVTLLDTDVLRSMECSHLADLHWLIHLVLLSAALASWFMADRVTKLCGTMNNAPLTSRFVQALLQEYLQVEGRQHDSITPFLENCCLPIGTRLSNTVSIIMASLAKIPENPRLNMIKIT